ncbi:MAG TPA: hypothetical protein PKV15_02795 [Syntrophomonadaceae bacterium]|jgi:uncharacterized protein YqfB (UPF0267 family)|nr:hypothetical protein [Syntrophomonadaceae bacterium]HRX21722.1 hypothetical protein [Syntrophomonadaceae bacterium]
MKLKLASASRFTCGDLVTVKSLDESKHFCIIAIRHEENQEPIAVLKALFNETYIIEKPLTELKSLLIKGKL